MYGVDGYFLFIECSQHFSLVSLSSSTSINRKAWSCKMGMKNEIKSNVCKNAKIPVWETGEAGWPTLSSSPLFFHESTDAVASLRKLFLKCGKIEGIVEIETGIEWDFKGNDHLVKVEVFVTVLNTSDYKVIWLFFFFFGLGSGFPQIY